WNEMGRHKLHQPTSVEHGHPGIDSGTLCRERSESTTPQGKDPEPDGWFSKKAKGIGDFFSGHSESLLLRILDLVPGKDDSPISSAMLRHYVEKSGDPYVIDDIPKQWQDWIVKVTHGKPGTYKDL